MEIIQVILIFAALIFLACLVLGSINKSIRGRENQEGSSLKSRVERRGTVLPAIAVLPIFLLGLFILSYPAISSMTRRAEEMRGEWAFVAFFALGLSAYYYLLKGFLERR